MEKITKEELYSGSRHITTNYHRKGPQRNEWSLRMCSMTTAQLFHKKCCFPMVSDTITSAFPQSFSKRFNFSLPFKIHQVTSISSGSVSVYSWQSFGELLPSLDRCVIYVRWFDQEVLIYKGVKVFNVGDEFLMHAFNSSPALWQTWKSMITSR